MSLELSETIHGIEHVRNAEAWRLPGADNEETRKALKEAGFERFDPITGEAIP